jgi:hypothetical protein
MSENLTTPGQGHRPRVLCDKLRPRAASIYAGTFLMSMCRKLVTGFGLLISCSSANPQTSHGSVAVAYFSNDKIVFAADSRVSAGNLYTNDECKVTAPGGQYFIFATTGALRIRNTALVEGWDNGEESRRSFDKLRSVRRNPETQVVLFANYWAASIAHDFERLYAAFPNIVEETAKNQAERRYLTTAYFAGKHTDGTLMLVNANVIFDKKRIPVINYEVYQMACPEEYCALGRFDTAVEFIRQSSARAKLDAKTWKPPKGTPATDYNAFRAIHLVELTEKYDGKYVGGPIDAVEITTNGGVRWIRRKAECPAN